MAVSTCREMGLPLSAESVTVNTAVTVPLSPSVTTTLSIDTDAGSVVKLVVLSAQSSPARLLAYPR